MATVRDADSFNVMNNNSLARTMEKCSKVDGLISHANNNIVNGKKLIEQGDMIDLSCK